MPWNSSASRCPPDGSRRLRRDLGLRGPRRRASRLQRLASRSRSRRSTCSPTRRVITNGSTSIRRRLQRALRQDHRARLSDAVAGSHSGAADLQGDRAVDASQLRRRTSFGSPLRCRWTPGSVRVPSSSRWSETTRAAALPSGSRSRSRVPTARHVWSTLSRRWSTSARSAFSSSSNRSLSVQEPLADDSLLTQRGDLFRGEPQRLQHLGIVLSERRRRRAVVT